MADSLKSDGPKPGPALSKSLDDDLDDKPKKPTKPARGAGRNLGRGIMIASIFIAFAWVFASLTQPRYSLMSVETNDNTFIYRLDQRMGTVHFCTTQQCVELPIKERVP